MRLFALTSIAYTCVLTIADAHLHSAIFVTLGQGAVDAISDDGTIVAGGERRGAGSKAWRWTSEDGFTFLTPLSRGGSTGIRGMSGDGVILAGNSESEAGFEATVWLSDDSPVSLGTLPKRDRAWTWNISNDGNVVIGSSYSYQGRNQTGLTGFFWSSANGMEALDPLPEGDWSKAYGVSADGSVVVGLSASNSEDVPMSEATVWIDDNGNVRTVGLGKPDGQNTWAKLVSHDGSTVVGVIGTADPDAPYRACFDCIRHDGNLQVFRWTEATGVVPLGYLDGLATIPTGITRDASVIVGNAADRRRGFIWDESNGMRDLQTVLSEEHGVDALAGWYRVNLNTMSADARTLGGRVWACADCEFEAWALFLDRPLHRSLQAGDADQDLDFDQFDLVRVQIAGKYLTGQDATWGEGDWNAAPKIVGNGVFDQDDIVAALQANIYLTGPYAASANETVSVDGQASLVYHAATGQLDVDVPAGAELTSINIDSAAGIFTSSPAENLGGSFDNDTDSNIFKATFGGSFGSISLGRVAQKGLSGDFLLGDLTVVGSLDKRGGLEEVDLIYVTMPEPASGVVLLIGALLSVVVGAGRYRRAICLFPR